STERAAIQASTDFPMAYGVVEGQPQDTRLQRRGEPDRLGDVVPRRFLEVLGGDPLPSDAGSGRLELAQWLTRPSNPLTARVLVSVPLPISAGRVRLELAQWLTHPSSPLTDMVLINRVGQHLYGRGLVDTPSDFGTRGLPPSHPELLDFLTTEFIADGWSIKR